MFKNYFYLRRAVYELNPILKDVNIIDIYSQEKNKLFFHIPSEDIPNRHLIISVNPQSPYLILKDDHKKAKKNVVQFFQELLPLQINLILIAENDRQIKFNCNSADIYFSVSGSNTNVYIKTDLKIEEFKKSKSKIIDKVVNLNYSNNLNYEFRTQEFATIENIGQLKSIYPMISSEIKREILFRESLKNNLDVIKIFQQIVNEILYNEIIVGYCFEEGKVIFMPANFRSFSIINGGETFINYNESIQYYLRSYYRNEKRKNISEELEKFFDKELSSLSNKLNNLKKRLDNGSNEDMYYKQANLLLSNIYKFKKGMEEAKINDGEIDLILKLDPKLTPNENVKKYFDKAKGEKQNFNKSLELFNFTKQKYDTLKKEHKEFEDSKSVDEIEKIYNKLIFKKENVIKMDSGLKFKYWHYLIEDKYHVYVGRDSKSNDYLSIKFAKQNDYWFHARGLPGSHVVLKVENVKEGVPKDIIKKAASLAAHYSKAKTAGSASVSYTFAKFVHKKKGMEPGKVLLQKEKTLLVKPEIPKNTILVYE